MNTLAWDPTDSDPWLTDPEFGAIAPTAPGDAPDTITHPLGIPGLTFTSPLQPLLDQDAGYMTVNGERVGVAG